MTHRAPHKRLLDAWNLLSRGWKATVGFVASLGVILGFVFHPPWAGGSSSKDSSGPTTSTSAQACPANEAYIKELGIGPPITLADYWTLHPGTRPEHPSKERARTPVRTVRFRLRILGYNRKPLGVWWWMLTAGGKAVPEPTLQRQLAFTITPDVSPPGCRTAPKREIWVELPKRSGKYRVNVQLEDSDGQVDFKPTKVFTVTRPRS